MDLEKPALARPDAGSSRPQLEPRPGASVTDRSQSGEHWPRTRLLPIPATTACGLCGGD